MKFSNLYSSSLVATGSNFRHSCNTSRATSNFPFTADKPEMQNAPVNIHPMHSIHGEDSTPFKRSVMGALEFLQFHLLYRYTCLLKVGVTYIRLTMLIVHIHKSETYFTLNCINATYTHCFCIVTRDVHLHC